MIKPDPRLTEPAQKNELGPQDTMRDLIAEFEFRGKEIDRVNINLRILAGESVEDDKAHAPQ